ncbi:hypothetical protein [Gemmatimonas sp.]|jgi:hypothetical protein|uniref:hypothetical protein n=1 Tax=Gemmatimonas sp. TaxID=1962908 RepID=UPI0037C19F7D
MSSFPDPLPSHSPSPLVGDAFVRVQDAVLAVWPLTQHGQRELTTAERNLVLDHCGSDFRPLVELLLDLGQMVRPALSSQSTPTQPAAAWSTVRAAQVHRIIAARYLQPEVARWAVDVWGVALGLTSTADSPRAMHAADVVPADHANGPAPARFTAPSHRPSGHATNQAPRHTPRQSRAPAPAVGPAPQAMRSAGSGSPGPVWQPYELRAVGVFAVLAIVCWSALWVALQRRTAERPAERPAAAVAQAAPSIAPKPASSTRGDATGPDTMPVALDSARDLPSSPRADAMALAVRERGVAGRYRVVQYVRSVRGTDNCDVVARALITARVSEEVVAHRPGATEFSLSMRPVRGSLAADGWFVVEPSAGTTDRISWQFRMRGRFTLDGFQAESETRTSAIIRWGRQQQCVVNADLLATRLPAGTS